MLHNKVGEQNLFTLFGRFSLFIALLSPLSAGSFEDFRTKQTNTFENYKEESDRTFFTFLKSDWQAYQLEDIQRSYENPKPRESFKARNINVKKQGPSVRIQVPIKKKAYIFKKDTKQKSIDFFGTPIGFNIPDGITKAKFYPQTKVGIQSFYKSLALSSYEFLLKDIKTTSKDLNLNDWGKYMLIKKISEKLFTNQDESRLLSWFLFNKLGYSVRIGLANSHVVVMHYSKKVIYDTPSYDIQSKKFYVLSNYSKGSVGKVFTYEQNYPDATKALDLSMKTLPHLIQDTAQKTLIFRQYGEEYAIKYKYNTNLINFMSTYPQADYETFFNAPLEANTYRDIAAELKKYIHTKQASVALNFILNFVQNAFKYEVDSQQFGKEKVMFAQETLFYDKSDCEDRAILFAYLVKELFHIGVVGVKYKDHMATALYIPIKGDGVKVHSKKYIIADPTYANASIGQSMTKYKNIKPEAFIKISNEKTY